LALRAEISGGSVPESLQAELIPYLNALSTFALDTVVVPEGGSAESFSSGGSQIARIMPSQGLAEEE
jgi:hypothetical protein